MPRRHLRTLVSVLCASAAVLASAAPASGAKWYSWGALDVSCLRTDAGLLAAQVRVNMSAVNSGYREWARSFRLKARMVPTKAGLNLPRDWRTDRWPAVSRLRTDAVHRHRMSVDTQAQSPRSDWQVQIKMIWDRALPLKDVVVERKVPFPGCLTDVSG